MEVHISQKQTDVSIANRSVKNLVVDFYRFINVQGNEISIHFVNIKKISKLHLDYFQDPSPTDCMTFPLDQEQEFGYQLLGDIFICPAVAKEHVARHGGNLYQEITLYLVHGLLHLQGFDDLEPRDRRKMRAAEARYLAHVKEKNLWLFPKNSKNDIFKSI